MFQNNNTTTVKNETLKKMFSKSRRIWQAKIDTKGPLSESRDNFEDKSRALEGQDSWGCWEKPETIFMF